MITEWLMRAVAWIWEHLLTSLPVIPVPSWFSGAASAIGGVADRAAGFGAWLPFQVLGAVMVSVLAMVAVSLTVKVVRIVASFLTAGGGSAG